MEKSALKQKGLLLSIVLSVFIIICIFLAGCDYRQAIHRWNDESAYRVIGALQISIVVIAFLIIIISFLIFTMCSTNKGLIFFVSLYIIFNSSLDLMGSRYCSHWASLFSLWSQGRLGKLISTLAVRRNSKEFLNTGMKLINIS